MSVSKWSLPVEVNYTYIGPKYFEDDSFLIYTNNGQVPGKYDWFTWTFSLDVGKYRPTGYCMLTMDMSLDFGLGGLIAGTFAAKFHAMNRVVKPRSEYFNFTNHDRNGYSAFRYLSNYDFTVSGDFSTNLVFEIHADQEALWAGPIIWSIGIGLMATGVKSSNVRDDTGILDIRYLFMEHENEVATEDKTDWVVLDSL